MDKSESKHSKEKADSQMMPLKAMDQGKLESIDNTNVQI